LLLILFTCHSQFWVFLVSRQMALISTLPNFLLSFCGQNGCTFLFSWRVPFRLMSINFILFLRVKILFPNKIMGTASALYTFMLENLKFLTFRKHLFCRTILNLSGSCPKKYHRLRFFWWYFHSKNVVMFCNVKNHLCKLSSESAIMNWSSAKCRRFIFVLLDKVMSFVKIRFNFIII